MLKSLTNQFLLTVLGIGFFLSILANCNIIQALADDNVFTPSVPEFSVNSVSYPYYVPPSTKTIINEFTGEETVINTEGKHVENRSIEVVIKNQQFTPYTDDEGNEINLYYNVRAKGHFGDEWEELYSRYKGSSGNPIPSNSEYTVLSLSANYPEGGQVDFQVEAIAGYYYDEYADRPLLLAPYALKSVKTSGWSPTQTITIEYLEIPEFPSWSILPLFLIASFAIIACKKKLTK